MRALSCFIASFFLPARRALAGAALLGIAASGCTLITDVDRTKIPDPPLPTFPEVDAGAQPGLDASAPHELDASTGADAAPAGDGGAADAGALDAGLDASGA